MFNIELHKNEYISNSIRTNKCWEAITSEVLLELFTLFPTSTFIDIGANIGYFSLLAASKGLKTIAFEPIKENYNLFIKSIQKNDFNIEVHNIALSDKEGEIEIKVFDYNMGLCSTRECDNDMKNSSIQKSTTRQLDNYISDNLKHCIVKIDVECMELEVLKGMTDFLSSGKVDFIIEISRYNKEIFDILRNNGYIYCINIGFDGKDKTTIDFFSTHLSTKKYYLTIDTIEQDIINNKKQLQILFYRTPTPI